MTPGNKEITQELVRLMIHPLTVSKGFQGPDISASQMCSNHMAGGGVRAGGVEIWLPNPGNKFLTIRHFVPCKKIWQTYHWASILAEFLGT